MPWGLVARLQAEEAEFRFGHRFRSSPVGPLYTDQIEAGIRFRLLFLRNPVVPDIQAWRSVAMQVWPRYEPWYSRRRRSATRNQQCCRNHSAIHSKYCFL